VYIYIILFYKKCIYTIIIYKKCIYIYIYVCVCVCVCVHTYAACSWVVESEAGVTFTHRAEVWAHTAAVSTAALVWVLLRAVAWYTHTHTHTGGEQNIKDLLSVCELIFPRQRTKRLTRVVVGERRQEVLLAVRLRLQMHLTQTAEHLCTREEQS